jgi:hypothetical protein
VSNSSKAAEGKIMTGSNANSYKKEEENNNAINVWVSKQLS